MKVAGENVKRIINEEFDARMDMAVITFIINIGFERLEEMTEEDILKTPGNGLMTAEFCQALVRCAVRICKECNEIDDFLPYIVNYLYVPKAKMNNFCIYQDEMTKYRWERLIDELDIDYEETADEIEMVELNATVLNAYRKEN